MSQNMNPENKGICAYSDTCVKRCCVVPLTLHMLSEVNNNNQIKNINQQVLHPPVAKMVLLIKTCESKMIHLFPYLNKFSSCRKRSISHALTVEITHFE